MAGVLRANIPNLVKVDLDKVLFDNWKNLSHEPIKNAIFSESTSTKKEEKHLTAGSLGLLAVKEEGTDLTERSFREGYLTTYTHKPMGFYISWSKEAQDDEQYGVIRKLPKAIARSADATYNYYMSRIFGYATSTTDDFISGGDGVALLSASHPCRISGGTYSNTPSTAVDLTETSLWAGVTAFYEMLNDAGVPIANSPRYLLVPHQGQKKAFELLYSEKTPESANNSINALRRAVSLEPVVWPYWLGAIDSDCWFLLSDKAAAEDYPLRFITRTKPETETDNDTYSKDFIYTFYTRFSVGYDDPRFVYGSMGG